MGQEINWLDVDLIGQRLAEAHPNVDPLTVRFPALRDMVRALPGFTEDPRHPVNERILETIQAKWNEEYRDIQSEEEEEEKEDEEA